MMIRCAIRSFEMTSQQLSRTRAKREVGFRIQFLFNLETNGQLDGFTQVRAYLRVRVVDYRCVGLQLVGQGVGTTV